MASDDVAHPRRGSVLTTLSEVGSIAASDPSSALDTHNRPPASASEAGPSPTGTVAWIRPVDGSTRETDGVELARDPDRSERERYGRGPLAHVRCRA